MSLSSVMAIYTLGDLLWSDLWHRFPDLRFALTEGDIGWIPYFLQRAEHSLARHNGWMRHEAPQGRGPTELFHDQILCCFIEDAVGVELLDRFNVANVCWESDYPHSDSSWPDAPEHLAPLFAGRRRRHRRRDHPRQRDAALPLRPVRDPPAGALHGGGAAGRGRRRRHRRPTAAGPPTSVISPPGNDSPPDPDERTTMTETTDVRDIGGWTAPGFEGVRDAFAANFAEGPRGRRRRSRRTTAGELVADLWGGVADVETGRPWAEDTMVVVYSSTKGATATCAHMLADAGRLDLDAPVAEYWPEFAQAGKEAITVSDLLSHQAGLAWVDEELTLEQVLAWEPIVDALARQAPLWEPRSAHGYHAVTYGNLVGEVVRRVDGRSLGTFFAEEVATPLGLDFFIGLPEEHEPRVAMLVGQPRLDRRWRRRARRSRHGSRDAGRRSRRSSARRRCSVARSA